MAAKPKPLKYYCEILGVSPSASPEEVRLAYVLLKREAQTSQTLNSRVIEEAYRALASPNRAANAEPNAGRGRLPRSAGGSARRIPVSALLMLASMGAALAATIAFYVWPMYGYKMRRFEPSDPLVEERTGKPYGTILQVEAAHKFSNGKYGAAYRVRLEPDGHEVWMPQNDVNYLCRRR